MRAFFNNSLTAVLLLFLVLPASAQEASALAARIKRVIKEKESSWKATEYKYESRGPGVTITGLEWVSGKQYVIVELYEFTSRTEAEAAFQDARVSLVASPGRAVAGYKFGDESFISAGNGFVREGYANAFFRSGSVMVRVNGSSVAAVIKFCQQVVAQINGG